MMKRAIPSVLAAALLWWGAGPAAAYADRIEGAVTGPGGEPLGGAVLELRHAGRLQPEYMIRSTVVADAGGRFLFEGLEPRAPGARLHARLPGRPMATLPGGVDADAAAGGDRLTVALEPVSTLRIVFRVPPGLPPAAGAVSLDREERWEPFAGEAFLSGLPAGAFGVKYHTDLYGDGVFFTSLPERGVKDTAIDLAKPEWIEGRVLDGAGTPLEGALYRAENAFRGMVSRTGKDGVFRLARSRTGVCRVHFRHPRHPDTAVTLGGKGSDRPEVRLRDGAAPIAGRLESLPVDPRACLVTATLLNPRRPARARMRWPGGGIRRARPDSTGAFSLRGTEWETYRLRVDCPGAGSREDTASPGAALPAWTLGPARSLEGRVLSAEGGAPIREFRLRIDGLGGLPGDPGDRLGAISGEETPRSDSLGRFSIRPRFEGVNTVCADAPGHAPRCRLVAPDDTLPVEIRLERGLSLAVRAVDASGGDAAISGARVRIRRAGSKASGRGGAPDGDGLFVARGLPGGDYALDVRAPGRLPFRAVIDLRRDDTVQAFLPPGKGLEGALLDWKGRPARGLRVLARPAFPAGPACPDGIAEAPVSADGSFSLSGLGDCPVTLGVARIYSKSAPFLPLYRKDGILPGGESLEIRLPEPRTWEIIPVSGGMPVEAPVGIHVLIPPDPAAGPGEVLGHALGRSTFRGRFSVPAYVGMRYVAVIDAPGYRGRADTVVVPPGEDAYETRLEMEAWPGLRGRIAINEEQPDSGATPSAAVANAREAGGNGGSGGNGSYEGWTVLGPGGLRAPVSADGAFRLDGLPAGSVHLALRDGMGRLAWAGVALAGADEAILHPHGAASWMEGQGVDGEGRPVAGAAVILRRRESPEDLDRAVTDGEGRFRFLVPPGAWLACPEEPDLPCTRLGGPEAARAEGPAGAPPRVVFSSGNRKKTVSFEIPIPLPLRGTAALVGPAGPSYSLEMQGGEALLPAGAFPMAASGRHELVAAAYRPVPAALYWGARVLEADTPAIRMGAAGPAVTVSAVDPSGRPLAGVGIRFLPRPVPGRAGKTAPPVLPWGEAEGWTPPMASFGTDASGTLQCLGVEPGGWWVYASHPTHACAPLEWKAGVAGAEAAALSLVLAPGSPIRVKVTYGGFPVAGARAEVFDSLGNRAAPAAAGDGHLLECGAFPPGRYRVAVSAPGLGRLVRTAEVGEGGEANLEASLPAAGWLELLGEDLEDKVFYLKDRNNQVTLLERRAELPPLGPGGSPGGSLLFQGIPPDRYQVWMEGGRKGLGEVDIRPAGLTVLDVGRPGKVRMALPAGRG